MTGPHKTDTADGSVLTYQSAAAVGLILQDPDVVVTRKTVAALLRERDHLGVFLTPEQARKVAAELLAFADAAQADYERTVTPEQKQAMVRRVFGDGQKRVFGDDPKPD